MEASPPEPVKTESDFSKNIYLAVLGVLLFLATSTAFFLFLINLNKNQKPAKETATKSSQKSQEEKDTGYVSADGGLNLRKEPSSDSLVLLILPKNTEVKIISSQGDWYFVEANTKGFVTKEFITFVKPKEGILKTFSDLNSPVNFLYPDLYKIEFTKSETELDYNFQGNDSYGGFKVQTEKGFTSLGNYSLKNFNKIAAVCDIKFGSNAPECEKVDTDQGTLYLVLVKNTLYKISYLKTEGGLLTDLNNLIFSSFVFK
jgi:hypothetical protein